MYDDLSDPHEWRNRAHDPRCAKLKIDLAHWFPKRSASAVAGSEGRALVKKDEKWYWDA